MIIGNNKGMYRDERKRKKKVTCPTHICPLILRRMASTIRPMLGPICCPGNVAIRSFVTAKPCIYAYVCMYVCMYECMFVFNNHINK